MIGSRSPARRKPPRLAKQGLIALQSQDYDPRLTVA
jgi:hypothetical protein